MKGLTGWFKELLVDFKWDLLGIAGEEVEGKI